MHERSLVRALFNQIAEIARFHPSSRVASIRVSCGRFSGVEPDLFRLALEEMLPASPYRGATVDLQICEIEALCPACGHRFAVMKFCFTCPRCGWQRTRVVQGEELMLESLVLQEDSSCPAMN